MVLPIPSSLVGNEHLKKILLDVHIDSAKSIKGINNGIRIIVGKKNYLYKENYAFANMLLKELKKSNDIEASIFVGELVTLNQDISPKSLMIEIWNSNSSEEDIQTYVKSLVAALKNLDLD